MNRILKFSLITFVVACASVAFPQTAQPSLGEYARAIKKNKGTYVPPEKKVYDNENLPANSSISVVGNPSADTPSADTNKSSDTGEKQPASADSKPSSDSNESRDGDAKKDEPQVKPGQSADERKQAVDAWKEKLEGQNDKIAKLSHEAELLEREYRVKSAEFYANTANRAQNPTGFAKDDADYKQQIADKQKALDAEKAKLSDMQEDARRQGVPDSATDRE